MSKNKIQKKTAKWNEKAKRICCPVLKGCKLIVGHELLNTHVLKFILKISAPLHLLSADSFFIVRKKILDLPSITSARTKVLTIFLPIFELSFPFTVQ